MRRSFPAALVALLGVAACVRFVDLDGRDSDADADGDADTDVDADADADADADTDADGNADTDTDAGGDADADADGDADGDPCWGELVGGGDYVDYIGPTRPGGRVDIHGDLVAYDKPNPADADQRRDIFVASLDGCTERCLTCEDDQFDGLHVWQPRWHPGGDWIVAVAEDPDAAIVDGWNGVVGRLVLVAEDGTGSWPLDVAGERAHSPRFSGDGARLYWTERRDSEPSGSDFPWLVPAAIRVATFESGGDGPVLGAQAVVRIADITADDFVEVLDLVTVTDGDVPEDLIVAWTASDASLEDPSRVCAALRFGMSFCFSIAGGWLVTAAALDAAVTPMRFLLATSFDGSDGTDLWIGRISISGGMLDFRDFVQVTRLNSPGAVEHVGDGTTAYVLDFAPTHDWTAAVAYVATVPVGDPSPWEADRGELVRIHPHGGTFPSSP
jgi:hypothetical protein